MLITLYKNENGRLHRSDGPAITFSETELWVINGKIVHSADDLKASSDYNESSAVYYKLSGKSTCVDQFFKNLRQTCNANTNTSYPAFTDYTGVIFHYKKLRRPGTGQQGLLFYPVSGGARFFKFNPEHTVTVIVN